ncbi:MAG TPA: T9SS type A sorting domain-containing protein, partial [Sphingobacteriaceae bacterium]
SLTDSPGPTQFVFWEVHITKTSDVFDLGENNILDIWLQDLGLGSFVGSSLNPPAFVPYGAFSDLRIKDGIIKMNNDLEVDGTLDLKASTSALNLNGFDLLLNGPVTTSPGKLIGNESSTLTIFNSSSSTHLKFAPGAALKALLLDKVNPGSSSTVQLRNDLRIVESLVNTPALSQLIVDAGVTLDLAGIYSGNGTLAGKPTTTLIISGDGDKVTLPMSANTTLGNVQITRPAGAEFKNNFTIGDALNIYTVATLVSGNLQMGGGARRGELLFEPGSNFDIGGGTLHLNGTTTLNMPSTAFFSGSDESVLTVSGSTEGNSTLYFNPDPSKARLKTLTVNKRNSVITIANPLAISENLIVNGVGSELNSNGQITLLSSAAQTANVEPITNGAKITGAIKVERFVSGGPKSTYRGYRMLSSPVYDNTTDFITSGTRTSTFQQYIDDIYITGPNTSGGFDTFTGNPNNPTIWTYNEGATTASGLDYVGINTISDVLEAGRGAMVFFRGARTNPGGKLKAPYDNPENVIIDYDGILNQGDISIPLSFSGNGEGTDGYNLLGNPYASTIDWNSSSWVKSNITGQIWIYNPIAKQYAIYDGTNGTNGGNQYIAPGQAFFVKSTASGSITFREGVKVNMAAGTDFPLLMSAPMLASTSSTELIGISKDQLEDRIRIKLVKDNNSDEALIVFRGGSKAGFTMEDARDMHGEQLFLSTLSADSALLGINYMPQASTVDRVRLYVSASAYGSYWLQFPEISVPKRTRVFLKDNFLGKSHDLGASTSYAFDITSNKASFGAGRFELMFEQLPPPVTLSAFSGKKTNGGIRLEWTTKNENSGNDVVVVFELEKSTDGETFSKLTELEGKGNANYNFLDKHPITGDNYYRLKTVFSDNTTALSEIVKINYTPINAKGENKPKVYPNPAESEITIYLEEIAKVQAVLNIYDKDGRKAITKDLGWIEDGLEIRQDVRQLRHGIYFVEVVNVQTNKQIFSSKLIKQ